MSFTYIAMLDLVFPLTNNFHLLVCQVMKYAQFRIRRSPTTPDEVWVQAREWPGKSRDEPWSWKHSCDTHVCMFPHGIPNLLESTHAIPPLQRPEGQTNMSPEDMASYHSKILKGTNPSHCTLLLTDGSI
jgi:hypothetical protein